MQLSICNVAKLVTYLSCVAHLIAAFVFASITTEYNHIIFPALVLSFVILVVIPYIAVDKLLIKPLAALESYIEALTELSDSTTIPSSLAPVLSANEFNKIINSIGNYTSDINLRHQINKQQSQKMWQLAHTDELTNIGNRNMLTHDIKQLTDSPAGLSRIDICFAMIDADNFKHINDTYGHDSGDRVLQHIAQAIIKTVRKGDKVYRIGGDEFAVLFINTKLANASNVLARCSENINIDISTLGVLERPSVSIGVAHTNAPITDKLASVKKNADKALYVAKGSIDQQINKDCVAIPTMET